MSASASIFRQRESSIPPDGFMQTHKELSSLMTQWSQRMKEVGQEPESEEIKQAVDWFLSHYPDTPIVCIRSAKDAVQLFNMNYIALGGQQIIQLLKCYHHTKNFKTACNIWLFNEQDVFDDYNKYGIPEKDCV